ncbi:adenylate kinase domain-containing protein [Emydomyces testavorans]|uniref:Adenylate kinase domain-containing protein n=1 Tax=Emydomyces testavorans TaxID=2070801 RepID=A0AAF0IL46_9EURO|nr:adenylate kinase domain-containing protein [Emydomyces testavorans]
MATTTVSPPRHLSPSQTPDPHSVFAQKPVVERAPRLQMNGIDRAEKEPPFDATTVESKPQLCTEASSSHKNPELLVTRHFPAKPSPPPIEHSLASNLTHRKVASDDSAHKSHLVPEEKRAKTPDLDETDPTGPQRDPPTRRSSEVHPTTDSAPASSRKQTNGMIGSVYSGNKIRHLKKDDGIPLWRKDIQYDFLKYVFDDKTACFTRFPEGDKNLTFADLYLDTMAKSSKTSKVLKEKLQHDKPAALNMAMVCLLVNFGRMNTTLNFFPEMRAQLRTYHSIPSLQAHQDPSAYKQLQDAPRLKSILKGASEDVEQPSTIEKIRSLAIPRTNPVNLIFVLSQYAPKISELHFFPPGDFFDLVMRPTLSSKSRARAFLWLVWYYLESDFSEKAALENPFGLGTVGEGTEGLPLKVPAMEELTEAGAEAENVDPPEEVQYGEEKQLERKRILEEEDVVFRPVKRQKKDYASDGQASEDTAPPSVVSKKDKSTTGGRRREAHGSTAVTPLNPAKRALEDEDLGEAQTLAQVSKPRAKRPKRDSSANRPAGGQPQRLVLKTRMDQTSDASSPAPPGAAHPILNQYSSGNTASVNHNVASRRPRPLTQHQIALEQNRKQRVHYALAQRRAETWNALRIRRENEVPFARAGRLLHSLPASYDTDSENSWGKGGICPNPEEEEDYGEAASFYFSVIRKVARRLQRWDWDLVLSDEKDYPANGLGVEYNRRTVEEPCELEIVNQPTPSAGKSKSKSAAKREKKAGDDAADAPKQNGVSKKPASRASASSQKKPSGEKSSGKKSRPRARPSKGASKAAAATAATAEAQSLSEAPDVSVKLVGKGTGRGNDVLLDDIDKDLLGELSPPDTRSRLDDASSIGLGPEAAQEDDGDDTEELSDMDMELSKLTENGYSRGESSSLENDVDASRLDDDEATLEA